MIPLFPVTLALALAATPISIKYEGPLKNALEQIADKGGLNVVVTADLDEDVKVSLSSLPAEEALEAIAKIYKLDVKKEGHLWVIRRADGAGASKTVEKLVKDMEKGQAEVDKLIAGSDAAKEADKATLQVKVNDQPVISVPLPMTLPDPDAVRDSAERARDVAEAAREHAEELRDQARELADAQREEADALKEAAQAKADEVRAQVEAGDVVVTGGPVVVAQNTTVDSAVAYGGPVVIEQNARVKGDAVAFGGDVVLKENARVNGDAVSFGGRVVKEANARIDGEEVAMGGGGLGHTVASKVVRDQVRAAREEHDGAGFGRSISSFLLSFALFFGLGFLLMMFAPQRMRQLEAAIARQPVKNGFAGLLGLFVAVPLTLLLAVTLIGIPIAVVMWLAIPVAMFAGVPAIANVIGERLPLGRVRRTQALVLAVGLAVLLLVAQLPVAGPMVMGIASLISLGAIIRTRFGQSPKGLPVPETVDHVAA